MQSVDSRVFFRLGASCSLNAELMSSFRVSDDGALFWWLPAVTDVIVVRWSVVCRSRAAAVCVLVGSLSCFLVLSFVDPTSLSRRRVFFPATVYSAKWTYWFRGSVIVFVFLEWLRFCAYYTVKCCVLSLMSMTVKYVTNTDCLCYRVL